jgi:hypothetical protein
MPKRARTVMVAAASVGALSCGDGRDVVTHSSTDDGAAGGAGFFLPIPENQLVDELVAAICAGMHACCAGLAYTFDEGSCGVSVREHYDRLLAAHSDVVGYDSIMVGDCVRASRERAAACEYPDSETHPCNRILVGTRPLGSRCRANEECARPPNGEPECVGPDLMCVANVRGGPGDSCVQTCTLDGSTVSCGELRAGAGRQEDYTRVRCWTNDGLRCADDATCQPVIEIGAECSLALGGAYCVHAGYCDPATRACEPRLAVGVDCQPGAPTSCVGGAFCSEGGLCEARKPDGAECGDEFEEECAGFCHRVIGTCVGGFAAGLVTPEVCGGAVMATRW